MENASTDFNNLIEKEYLVLSRLREEISKVMIGQHNIVDKLFVGLLSGGHILVEGVPGLAKTTVIKALSDVINSTFSRIQFTPDLLPADLVGTQIYSQSSETFQVLKGPLFANIILADEINRSPAKVQSALLEAMAEKQVTIGKETFNLPSPFMVMATQNPVEQEGTYPLPEAQVDRFMLKVLIDYPSKDEEILIMEQMSKSQKKVSLDKILTPEKIIEIRSLIENIFIDKKLYSYIADIIFATRNPSNYGLSDLKNMIDLGASPRASINLVKASKVVAFLKGRSFVIPADIKSIGMDVLRHRLTLSYEAESQDLTSDDILAKIFDSVIVP